MKKIILILAAAFFSFSTMAQDETKVRVQEAGIGFSGLNNGFALIYKIGNQNSLWRFNSLVFNGSNSNEKDDSLTKESHDFNFAFNAGKEFRKAIIKNLEFRYGANVGFSYQYYKYDNKKTDYYNETKTYSPGISLVFGLNYVIKEKLVVGAELLPRFNYNFGNSTSNVYNSQDLETTDNSGFSYGLTNQSVLLSILYRF